MERGIATVFVEISLPCIQCCTLATGNLCVCVDSALSMIPGVVSLQPIVVGGKQQVRLGLDPSIDRNWARRRVQDQLSTICCVK